MTFVKYLFYLSFKYPPVEISKGIGRTLWKFIGLRFMSEFNSNVR